MARNLPKQHRSVYEKSFNLKHVLKNLQSYKLASGGVHPKQLRQAREIYGDDEGKVYGALVSQEAGSSLEGRRGEQGQRSKRKRRRRGHTTERKISRLDSTLSSTSTSSFVHSSTDSQDSSSLPSGEIPSPMKVGGASIATQTGASNTMTSLNLLSAAYSDSSSGSSDEDVNQGTSEPRLDIPDSIQQMFTQVNSSMATSSCRRSHDHDSDPGDLGYFEPVDSDDSIDSDQETTPTVPVAKLTEEAVKVSCEFTPPSLKVWDLEKKKFVYSPSPLSSYVCWKCSKIGHLPSDCTVTVKDGSKKRGQRERFNIPQELKSLYSRCRELQKRKSDHCVECGVHSNLACCLECGSIHCDGRGHLSSHLLSYPSHNQLYSYKLTRMLKCCKASCPVVSIYELLVCSHCLSKAFSQHYSMVNATWSQSGLRAIPNTLCCEDHFDWHRANCPSIGEEHFLTVAALHSKYDGIPVKLISEFFF